MIYQILSMILRPLPSLNIINSLRGYLLGLFMKGSKRSLKICSSVKIVNPKFVYIGDNVIINPESILIASSFGRIEIGNDVLIAPRCYIQTQNHNFIDKMTLIRNQGANHKSIIIEDDVWLGYGVIVLTGTRIRTGSVVAAGAVVTKDTEEYSVNGGVPAKTIKYRE